MDLAFLDWIILLALLASLALGAWRGLVYEVILVLGWVAAFVLAQWWAPEVAHRLPGMRGASEPLRYALGFALVFIAAIFTAGLIAWGIKKLIEAVGLRPVDRVLGAVFGLARGALAVLAVAVVINLTTLREQAWWRDSIGASAATDVLVAIQPLLPAEIGQHLPSSGRRLEVRRV